ncbi:MAG: 16S rRNA (uracil(1498)-N(3))-methyltransferase [Spirochaetaceae bacterium]|nr:16S rRNA (uracil(1498)-N(3))-methyltransferase [Spirochaetaceae bacterium]
MNLILFEEDERDLPLQKRDPRAIHLVKTLHKKAGDEFDAGILGGKRGKGRITQVFDDGRLLFSLNLTEFPPPRLPVTVAVGFPRPIQTRRLLRDLSSMGVSAVHLVCCELSDKNYLKTTLLEDGGARAALIEGASQSRDTTLPQIAVFSSLKEWLEDGGVNECPEASRIACDNVEPEGVLGGVQNACPAALAIGPERGWSDRERLQFRNAGFKRLSLGCRALRTETACIAAIAALGVLSSYEQSSV